MQEFFFKLVEETDSYCAMSYHGDEPHVIIPSTHWGRPVTMLFDDLFKNHHEITSVVIPDSVREIGGFAFDSCDNLLNITLPANLRASATSTPSLSKTANACAVWFAMTPWKKYGCRHSMVATTCHSCFTGQT